MQTRVMIVSVLTGIALLFGAAMLVGCSVNDAPTAPVPTVQSQFFPMDNGRIYTYRRFTNNHYDTINLRLVISQNSLSNVFVNTLTGDTFYRIGFTHDANNNLAAALSTDTSSLMALDGTLEPGATWIADEINGIHATVIKPYDDYYLPSPTRQEDYHNVLEVEYHQDGQPSTTYTLRFFARDCGLILERQIVAAGPNSEITEIASMELLSIQSPN